MEYNKLALWYQGKSYFVYEINVRMWSCGTRANHVSTTDQMLDGGFVASASSLQWGPIVLDLDGQMKE